MKKLTLLTMLPMLAAAATLGDPPKVLSTSPEFWAVGVNPSQKSASVTFDQPMRPGFWDWLGRDTLSPSSTLHATMTPDRLTCRVDVSLQPGKVYVMGLNERGIPGVGFQTEKGLSLPPTYLVFQTAGFLTAEDAPPHVIKTVPPNGSTALDAARLKSVVIGFDAAMNTKKHGVRLFEDKQLVDISRSPFQYSADGKTFALAYDFKPSKAYAIELNNLHDIGFASAKRVPLWPIQIGFATGQPR